MENTSVNINTGHNYKRKIPVLTGRTKFCTPPKACRSPTKANAFSELCDF